MYLSRVEIDLHNRKKLKKIAHVAAIHNWVESSFPEEAVLGIRTRKLWRIDPLKDKYYLLVVSQKKPDVNKLEKYGVKGSVEIKSYDKFLNSLVNGMQARFRITLNPVIAKWQSSFDQRGRILPHITAEKQLKFIMGQAEKNGFFLKPENVFIVGRSFEPFIQKNKKTIYLSKVTYEGLLTISDVNVFREALTKGIGKKKAYGFGMMTIIPIVES